MLERIRDYTRLEVGTKIDNSEIVICPHCKRRGLIAETPGLTNYMHRISIPVDLATLMPTGVTDEDVCPKTVRESDESR